MQDGRAESEDVMFALGRRDCLKPELELIELYVPMNGHLPSRMPDVGADFFVVLGVVFWDGVEKLSICETLRDMQNEAIWCCQLSSMTRARGFMWYAADRTACMQAYSERVAAG